MSQHDRDLAALGGIVECENRSDIVSSARDRRTLLRLLRRALGFGGDGEVDRAAIREALRRADEEGK